MRSVTLAKALTWMWIGSIIFVVVWLAFASVKSNYDLFEGLWALPRELYWENYRTAWEAAGLVSALRNSVFVVGASVAIIVLVSAPAAYVLSRMKFRGASTLTHFFAVGIGIPAQIILIPLFALLARVNLTNNLVGLVLVYCGLSVPFTVYLLTGFFRTLPSELEEAASIDGASPHSVFFKVMLPLARPGLLTAIALNAVSLWNEFLIALTLINENSKYTISLGVLALYTSLRYTANWAAMFAGVVIVMMPMIVFYALLSRQVIEGLTLGAGK